VVVNRSIEHCTVDDDVRSRSCSFINKLASMWIYPPEPEF